MKNRNLKHSDNWATPPAVMQALEKEFVFDFDPCPFDHDTSLWDGLECEWGGVNFINPPYSKVLKEAFVLRAIAEARKGKTCVMLLPVSTSTKLFHDHIQPNAKEIRFWKRRIGFIGINTKGKYVNWHLWDRAAPENAEHTKDNGMHDSMIVIF